MIWASQSNKASWSGHLDLGISIWAPWSGHLNLGILIWTPWSGHRFQDHLPPNPSISTLFSSSVPNNPCFSKSSLCDLSSSSTSCCIFFNLDLILLANLLIISCSCSNSCLPFSSSCIDTAALIVWCLFLTFSILVEMVSVFSLMSVMRLKKSSMGHNGTKWPEECEFAHLDLGISIWASRSGHLDR